MIQRMMISLSDNEYDTLRRLAYERHTSIAKLVREALDAAYGTQHDEIQPPGRKPREYDS